MNEMSGWLVYDAVTTTSSACASSSEIEESLKDLEIDLHHDCKFFGYYKAIKVFQLLFRSDVEMDQTLASSHFSSAS